jgi:acetylornithine/N-succinyldiaminopimelate aminotransferase
MTLGTHGSTYGGNPLACAVGCAVMDEITRPGFLDHVSRVAGRLQQGLAGLVAAHPAVFEAVRGEGLMLGLKCRAANADVVRAGYDARVLVVAAAENVIRILPPLNLTEAEVDDGLRRLEAAAVALEAVA